MNAALDNKNSALFLTLANTVSLTSFGVRTLHKFGNAQMTASL